MDCVSHYSHHKLGAIQKTVISRLYKIFGGDTLSMRITDRTLKNLISLTIPPTVLGGLGGIVGRRFVGETAISNALRAAVGAAPADLFGPAILKYSRELQHIGFYVSKPKNTLANPDKIWQPLGGSAHSVMAQHLRSFLFLSLAAAIAPEYGIKKIYVFENGPVAINPLFSQQNFCLLLHSTT